MRYIVFQDYVPRPKRRLTMLISVAIGGSAVLALASLVLCWYNRYTQLQQQQPVDLSALRPHIDGLINSRYLFLDIVFFINQ